MPACLPSLSLQAGLTPLAAAASHGHAHVAEALLTAGADQQAALRASEVRSLSRVECVLAHRGHVVPRRTV